MTSVYAPPPARTPGSGEGTVLLGAAGADLPGAAAGTLLSAASRRPPVGLAEVDATAALQTRVDRKYLVSAARLDEVSNDLGDRFRVLEIGGRRLLGYESIYFDSASFALFRDHRQGRRRRCKVRVRTYLDDGARFTEVKTKGGRGETVKHRIPHQGASQHLLGPDSRAFVDDVLWREYGQRAPQLVPVLESRYRRCTLVDPAGGERLTCDVDLDWRAGGVRRTGPDKILLESKTTGRGLVDQVLARHGIRPISMSKYAVGMALLHPELAANPWHRLLHREFGWRRR